MSAQKAVARAEAHVAAATTADAAQKAHEALVEARERKAQAQTDWERSPAGIKYLAAKAQRLADTDPEAAGRFSALSVQRRSERDEMTAAYHRAEAIHAAQARLEERKQVWDTDGTNAYTGTRFNEDGYDESGFNEQGYDARGFDWRGGHRDTGRAYDPDGYTTEGFDRQNLHKDTGTKYDLDGYNAYGYDADGYNAEGFDKHGFDANRFNRHGYDEWGFSNDESSLRFVHTLSGDNYLVEHGYTEHSGWSTDNPWGREVDPVLVDVGVEAPSAYEVRLVTLRNERGSSANIYRLNAGNDEYTAFGSREECEAAVADNIGRVVHN